MEQQTKIFVGPKSIASHTRIFVNVMVRSLMVLFEADAMNLEDPATRQRENSDCTSDQISEPQYPPNATSSISMSEVPGENEAQVSNALTQHSNIHTLALPMRPKEGSETGLVQK